MACGTAWADETDADAYLTDKPGTEDWFVTGLDKTPYLTTAFRTICFDPDYTIEDAPTGDRLQRLQNAQIEFAFFILKNPNFEQRENLINQGVTSFRIGQFSENLKSKSGRDAEGQTKYPSIVADYLRPFLAQSAFIVNIKRAQEDIV